MHKALVAALPAWLASHDLQKIGSILPFKLSTGDMTPSIPTQRVFA
ncbi:hypothetical protein [Sporisorium scitamineum]|uniref:Uncharacterized protein n=1 Tax=Sporisorium scitamineum TaxID=49012 RepID=A0A0F7RZT9_9BASI|nr:hypothetical protein [Sporisorium scitamineum]